MKISARVEGISESGTVKMSSLITEDIIDLAVGELDFPTPLPIINSTIEALTSGKTRYSSVAGLDELRDGGLVTNGAKQALYMTLQTVCSLGDEVIVILPYWPTFSEQVKLAGGTPVFADISDVKSSVTDKTRAILINTPNNPTGAVYSRKLLEEIAKLGLIVISDETYCAFVYEGNHVSMRDVLPESIVITSYSKTYSLAGYRVGIVKGPEDFISSMIKLQGHCTGNVCTFAQQGALAAKGKPFFEEMKERRDVAYARCSKLWPCEKPAGGFYLFPKTDVNVQDLLKIGVAVVAGEVFGAPGHIRISFTQSVDKINEAFDRIEKWLE
ncbi:aminotransferase class I/II-fold pyridoxal phosphate-dependent enzyme [Candidatus Woesearchaeota archaeon]|nr:aminotransferase class I/II-fold pyridoxal phosphate-dependent enzyme [Candidatus Woesearchaeota archaeon]